MNDAYTAEIKAMEKIIRILKKLQRPARKRVCEFAISQLHHTETEVRREKRRKEQAEFRASLRRSR